MKNILVKLAAAALLAITLSFIFVPNKTYAAGTDEAQVQTVVGDDAYVTSAKAWAAGIAIAVAAGLGAIGMGLVIYKSVDGIARQPEAEGKIRTAMMLGLVFVETAIIYALIVAILIVFVL